MPRAVGRAHAPVQMEYLPEYTMLSGRAASLGRRQYVAAASPDGGPWSRSLPNPQTFEIPSTTLETALADVGEIGLLKVDVEGMEMDVFDGIGDRVCPNPTDCGRGPRRRRPPAIADVASESPGLPLHHGVDGAPLLQTG